MKIADNHGNVTEITAKSIPYVDENRDKKTSANDEIDKLKQVLDLLLSVTKGKLWDETRTQEEGHTQLLENGLYGGISEIYGKTEQDNIDISPDNPKEILSVDEINIKKTGKNLLPIPVKTQTIGGITYDADGEKITVNGIRTSGAAFDIASIMLIPGKYTLSLKNGSFSNVHWFVKNISDNATIVSGTADTNAKFTLTESKIISFAIKGSNNNDVVSGTANIQLEFGSESTPYEKYREENRVITPPYPLNKIGEYSDGCDIENGLWTYNTGKITFNKDDEWNHMIFPIIIKQPQDQKGIEGSLVYFTIKAVGSNLRYKWQFRKNETSTWSSSGSEGADTERVCVQVTSGRNGQQYRCMITDSTGKNMYSDVATLYIAKDNVLFDNQAVIEPYVEIGDIIPDVVMEGTNLFYLDINKNRLSNFISNDSVNLYCGFAKTITWNDFREDNTILNAITLFLVQELNIGRIYIRTDKFSNLDEFTEFINGKNITALISPKIQSIDKSVLDSLRKISIKPDEHLYIIDNHGRDVSYLMKNFIKLEVI